MRKETGDEVHAENQSQNQNCCGFDAAMDDEIMGALCSEGQIWLDHQLDETIPVAADSSIFDNNFPPLPDFPCMSSTSSSSSTPALTKQFVSSSASPASSSSSAASWAMIKSDAEQMKKQDARSIKYDVATPVPELSSTDGFRPCDGTGMEDVDCMDVMNNFGYMDLIEDGTDLWDPSRIFQSDNDQTNLNQKLQGYQRDRKILNQEVAEQKMGLDELGVMFFEWLKNNKEHISAEDMRNIKFKRATIECASKRLGSTKEGRKQLLKLILEWVEQYQLQNRQNRDAAASHQVPCQYQEPFPNPNPNMKNSIPTTDANNIMLIPTPQNYLDQSMVAPAPSVPAAFPPPAMAYIGGDHHHHPFAPGANASPMNCQAYSPRMLPTTEYQMLEPAQSWPSSQFVLAPQCNSFPSQNGNFAPITPQPFAPVYGNRHPSQIYNENNGPRFGASATKEARKKRMARQRRGSLHHYRHHPHQNQLNKIDSPEQREGQISVENCTNNINGPTDRVNWLYWPSAAEAPILEQPPTEAQVQQQESQMSDRTSQQAQSNQLQAQSQSERGQQLQKQEFKGENNLKLLLQKVLKQSDVGNLGRIVLPKKEAETHLPQLNERDGISIAMEDIGTSKVWNLRYRFWPNNKSRMYLLENTGDFVKVNGLQEGDFIVIYSDIKSGKYLIRGVKVRQTVRPRSEARVKATRKNHHSSGAGNGHLSMPS